MTNTCNLSVCFQLQSTLDRDKTTMLGERRKILAFVAYMVKYTRESQKSKLKSVKTQSSVLQYGSITLLLQDKCNFKMIILINS
jgi:hypothetical protein